MANNNRSNFGGNKSNNSQKDPQTAGSSGSRFNQTAQGSEDDEGHDEVSGRSAEHHDNAAFHHETAALHHRQASEHRANGNHADADRHTSAAYDHGKNAYSHGAHAERHGQRASSLLDGQDTSAREGNGSSRSSASQNGRGGRGDDEQSTGYSSLGDSSSQSDADKRDRNR